MSDFLNELTEGFSEDQILHFCECALKKLKETKSNEDAQYFIFMSQAFAKKRLISMIGQSAYDNFMKTSDAIHKGIINVNKN